METKKTVFINGGTGGIGERLVIGFAEKGYRVAFSYLHSKDTAERLQRETGAVAICADSSDGNAVVRAAKSVLERWGSLDVLINNAAISYIKMFQDVSDEEWHQMWRINVDGPMRYIRAFLPAMLNGKQGRIINISSMWGQVGASCEVHYSTTKAALIGMTKALAKELGPSGITVNAIAPGLIQTPMNAALTAEDIAAICEETPLGRIGQPNDVLACALFLAEEGGCFITGQILSPNGGYVM